MREQKRIPKISLKAKRLIATEALTHPDMPRDYLAQSIREKIEALGELPPTEDTLKRRISEARQRKPQRDVSKWSLGAQLANQMAISPEAVKRVFEVLKYLKETYELSEIHRIPNAVVHWMANLHTVINDPKWLFLTAWAYALYATISHAADPDNTYPVDTVELDEYLLNEDYEALSGIAIGLYTIYQEDPIDIDLKALMERCKEVTKNNPKDGEK